MRNRLTISVFTPKNLEADELLDASKVANALHFDKAGAHDEAKEMAYRMQSEYRVVGRGLDYLNSKGRR